MRHYDTRQMKALERECQRADKRIKTATAQFDAALSELIHAERAHALALHRRNDYEGNVMHGRMQD